MTSSPQLSFYRLVVFAYALTVALVLVASFFPEERLWGFSWYAYLGWPGRLILLLVALTALPALDRLLRDRGRSFKRSRRSERNFSVAAVIVTAVVGLAFYLLRARTHFLGDGYLLLIRLAEGTHPIRPWNPAVYWVQDWMCGLVGNEGESSARLAFQIISYGSGLLFLAAAGLAAARLFDSFRSRLLFLLGAASGGYMLVFFGHVENYPLFVLMVAVFALTGMLAARGLISRWWVLLPLLLATPLHPFSAALVPGAVYLLAQPTDFGRWVAAWRKWVKALVLLVVATGAVTVFHQVYVNNYFFRFAIVPFVENRFTIEGYSMFSGKHLLDYLNLLWQLQPALLLLGLLAYSARSVFRQSEYRFLLLLGAASLGIAFLFDPKLGMPRDWDMFCFAGVPLTFLVFLMALDERVRTSASLKLAGTAVLLGVMLLIPRTATQALEEVSIEVFDNYSELDTFKNGSGRFLLLRYLERHGRYEEAERRRKANAAIAAFEFWDAEAQTLMRQGDYRAAMAKYHRMIDVYPCYHNAWTNLGISHYQLRQYDSAITCLRISDGLNPFSINVYHYLALAHYSAGHNATAERLWLEATELVPNDYRPYSFLLLMYQYDERPEDYRNLVERVLERSLAADASLGFVKRAAEIYLERGNYAAAAGECRRVLTMSADSGYVRSLQVKYPPLRVLDDAD